MIEAARSAMPHSWQGPRQDADVRSARNPRGAHRRLEILQHRLLRDDGESPVVRDYFGVLFRTNARRRSLNVLIVSTPDSNASYVSSFRVSFRTSSAISA